jgi:hypothetical protein
MAMHLKIPSPDKKIHYKIFQKQNLNSFLIVPMSAPFPGAFFVPIPHTKVPKFPECGSGVKIKTAGSTCIAYRQLLGRYDLKAAKCQRFPRISPQ